MDKRTYGGRQGTVVVSTAKQFVSLTANDILGRAELDELIDGLEQARREVFGDRPPTAAVIEVIDTGHTTDDTPGGSVIVPHELRINGHQVLTTNGGPRIHEITLPSRELAQVTVTLCARRIIVAAEGDL